jgi:hypothetical protein
MHVRVHGSIARAGMMAALGALACQHTSFLCAGPEDCSGGICQPTGYCSFPDDDCPSHQRYGDHAAAGYAGTCVGTGTATDASSDSGASTGTTSTGTGTTAAVDTSSESGTPSDLGAPPRECIDIEFDIVPLPGWEAFADGALASVAMDRLVIMLPATGDGEAGIARASTDVAMQSFAIEIVVPPDPGSDAQLGIEVRSETTAYGVYVGRGAVFAIADDGRGPNVLASQPYTDPAGLTLTLALDGSISYRVESVELGDTMLAEHAKEVTVAEARVVATSTADNRVDPGAIEIERLTDCPTTIEATRPHSLRH